MDKYKIIVNINLDFYYKQTHKYIKPKGSTLKVH